MRTSTLSVAFALVLLAARPICAQTSRADRPYRGLFGGGVDNTQQLLTFTMDFGGGYDGNVLIGQSGVALPVDPRRVVRSSFEQGSAGLAYALSGPRVGFSASGQSAATYYSSLAQPWVKYQSGSVGGSLQIASGTRLTAGETATYGPLFLLTSFPGVSDQQPGQVVALDESLGARVENHLALMGGVALTQSLTRRIALAFNYGYQRSHSPSGAFDLSGQSAGAAVNVSLAKGLGLQLGDGYWDGRYGTGAGSQRVHNQSLNAGLNFNRALSVSRRVTLSFATGSSAVSDTSHTWYGLTGTARLNREIGRTWNASLAVSRNAGFYETFRQPVISDSLGIGVGGLIARRVQFQSSLGVSTGQIGFAQQGNGFDTYYGSAGVTLGLTRDLGFGVDYSYVRYFFAGGVALPSGLPRRMDRQRVYAHLSLWVPLMQRARRPNAAR